MNIFENWNETKNVLLEGVDPRKRPYVERLLENQRQALLTEDAPAGTTDAHSIAGFRKVLIPMIRRIIPGTIASELVGIQPMSGPVGMVYSMRYQYNDTPGAPSNVTAGDELFGNQTPIDRFYSGGTDTAQLPGAGGFGPRFDVSDAQDGSVVAGVDPITGAPTGEGWGSSLDKTATTGDIMRGGSGSFAEGTGGRSVSLRIVSQAIEARSRKLQASWTFESMQDLQSQHGLDIETELTQALAAEIVHEIDNEIINDLLALAGTVTTWDGSVPATPSYYQPTFAGDRFANLGVKINVVANEIARKTRRGAGNFIVASPMMVSVIQSAAKSVFAPAIEGSFKGPNNSELVGTLNGTIKVYSYIWNQSRATDVLDGGVAGTGNDELLIGYKGGNGETDAGYFYCPYIPLTSTGVVINPVTTTPMVSLMTRYGKAVFTDTATSLGNSADYYGKITITNLSFN